LLFGQNSRLLRPEKEIITVRIMNNLLRAGFPEIPVRLQAAPVAVEGRIPPDLSVEAVIVVTRVNAGLILCIAKRVVVFVG
jgi:hypothetical protein